MGIFCKIYAGVESVKMVGRSFVMVAVGVGFVANFAVNKLSVQLL